MREAGSVLHPAKQESVSIWQQHRRRVEDAIDRIRPILSAEDWVRRVTRKQGQAGR
jgi:hypothetical protein